MTQLDDKILMAWIDGELPPVEADRIKALIDASPSMTRRPIVLEETSLSPELSSWRTMPEIMRSTRCGSIWRRRSGWRCISTGTSRSAIISARRSARMARNS